MVAERFALTYVSVMENSRVIVPTNRRVNFGQAIVLFFINYIEFSGRSSAGAYWYFALWSILLAILFAVLDSTLDLVDKYLNFSNTLSLITLVPSISLSIRRLHDINRSGWWFLLSFTVVGLIPIIYWACQRGDRAENDYGPDQEAGRDS